MIINKIVQALAKNISAKGALRPKLNSVYFKDNKAVATDTYKLSEITFEEVDTNSLPLIEGFIPEKYLDLVIHSEDILNLKIPKSKTPILNNAFIGNVSEDSGEKDISIATTDTIKDTIINTKGLDVEFPCYQDLFLKHINLEVGMNIEVLEKLLKLYKVAGFKDLKFSFKDAISPIEINGLNKAEGIEGIRSILMPIKFN